MGERWEGGRNIGIITILYITALTAHSLLEVRLTAMKT